MKDVKLDDERDHHWRMVFEDYYGVVDNKKEFLHAKRWYIYLNQEEDLIKSRYYVEVFGSDGKMILWRVVDGHFVQDGKDHYEIGLWIFDFNLFDKDEEGDVE